MEEEKAAASLTLENPKLSKYVEITSNFDVDWNKMWEKGKTIWHANCYNPLLLKHFDKVETQSTRESKGLKVLVPLCGKDMSLRWLSDRGHTVIGVEANKKACVEFFRENDIRYTSEHFNIDHVKGEIFRSDVGNICLYQCDFFAFTPKVQKGFDVIWDRGSLTSMIKKKDQVNYVSVLKEFMTPSCINITEIMCGESSSKINQEQIQTLYGEYYKVDLLDSADAYDKHYYEIGIVKMELFMIKQTEV